MNRRTRLRGLRPSVYQVLSSSVPSALGTACITGMVIASSTACSVAGDDWKALRAEEPRLVATDSAPKVANPGALIRTMERHYSPSLRRQGVRGEVPLWLLIDRRGAVREVRLIDPGAVPALDSIALLVAQAVEFRPARRDGRAVPVWWRMPIGFGAPGEQGDRLRQRWDSLDGTARAKPE